MDEIQQFFEEGYVIVRNVIADDDLPRYRAAYERMVEKVKRNPTPEFGTRLMKGETWGCNALLHPDLYEPEFIEHITNPKLLSALRSILGAELRVAGLKAIWSDEHMEYDLIWHRDGNDEVFTPDGSQAHIQFNTALYPDSCFRLVPGSHRRPLTVEEQAQARTGVAPLPGEVIAAIEPGDALFMHSHTFHRGKAAVGTFRRTLHTILARADKPASPEDIAKHRGWYNTLGIEKTLDPVARQLFDAYFQSGAVQEEAVGAAAY